MYFFNNLKQSKMKKFYMLFVAVLFAVTASAQVALQNPVSNARIPYKPADKQKAVFAPRATTSGEIWINYPVWDAIYFGADTIADGMTVFLHGDTVGLFRYSDGYSTAWIHSIAQVYDFTSTFFDEIMDEGEMSFNATEKLNLDSIMIYGLYIRDDDYTGVDTLIVGFMALPENTPLWSFGQNYPNTCHVSSYYDMNTGVQTGATHFFKIPLTEAEESQPGDQPDYYKYSIHYIDAGIKDITNKIWHVAFTFKSGQNFAENDTMKSRFTTYFDLSADPDYFIDFDNPNRCSNLSHGMVSATFSNTGYNEDYYPCFALGNTAPGDAAFSDNLRIKVSCTECAVVNVPEIEKNNPTIYPNPATDKFTVNLGSNETATVQLYNIVGQQVYSGVVTGSEDIKTNHLNSGVYMLKINQNGKVYTSKVVVK